MVDDWILYWQTEPHKQLVLPEKLKPMVLMARPNDMRHVGAERVTHLAHERFYSPNMQHDVETYVSKSCVCIKQKRPNLPQRAPMEYISRGSPFSMCRLSPPGVKQYILVPHFGYPEKLHHNQNKEFEKYLFSKLQQLAGIWHSWRTSYHPQSNPVERLNCTLLQMMRTL